MDKYEDQRVSNRIIRELDRFKKIFPGLSEADHEKIKNILLGEISSKSKSTKTKKPKVEAEEIEVSGELTDFEAGSELSQLYGSEEDDE